MFQVALSSQLQCFCVTAVQPLLTRLPACLLVTGRAEPVGVLRRRRRDERDLEKSEEDYFESDDNEADTAEGPSSHEQQQQQHQDLGNRHRRSRSRSPDVEQGGKEQQGGEGAQHQAGVGVGSGLGEGARTESGGSPRGGQAPASSATPGSSGGGPGEAWLGLVEYEDDDEEGGRGEEGAQTKESEQGGFAAV
eukprot:scaffold322442_cov17-Tisochrysis_lutea.AAC.1